MAGVYGKKEYLSWLEDGKKLSRKEAMLAQCYICNGEEGGRVDCQGQATCPMYPYFKYKGVKRDVDNIDVATGVE